MAVTLIRDPGAMALTRVQLDTVAAGGGTCWGGGMYRGRGMYGSCAAAGNEDAMSEAVSVSVSAAFMVTPW
jgi:hypothetical protein